MAVFHRLIKESADTRLQNICTQDLDDSLLGNFRFLKKRIRTLVNDESHSMQTHVVDLDFFERATLLRLEQLGMRVEKTLVKRRKRSSERIQIPDDEKTDVRDDTEQQKTEVNVDDTNIGEATIVMYEIEKILDEHVNKCLDIFDLTDERDKNDADNYLISLTEENAKKDDQEDVKGVVNILKIDRKTKLSFDDILSSMHNDYYEQKYK